MRDYKPGDRLQIKTQDGKYVGILMERPELADDKHLVIKLDSGYNVGIDKEKITEIKILEAKTPKDDFKVRYHKKDPAKKKVAILATGGTIASRVDYITGGVHSAFSAEELISAVPELEDVANISGRQIFNKFSENVVPADWKKIAEAAAEEIKAGAAGVVITHGTDTMGYTAAALSFMLKTPVPVVLTGAQRSSDRGSSDAAVNLVHATKVAVESGFPGVVVVMHAESSDSFSLILRGTRVKKLHSSRRDAFESVNEQPLGRVSSSGVELFGEPKEKPKLSLDTSLDENVFLLKYTPGLKKEIISSLVSAGYHGIVVEGTGLGHTSEDLVSEIKSAVASGVAVAMCSQTVFGRVNMKVYSTGRLLLEAGVISCEDMLSETAYVKLMWALGHTKDPGKVGELMLADYAGELSERTEFVQKKPRKTQ